MEISFVFKFKKGRGVTLIEVFLATGIFAILASTIFYIYVVSARSWIKVRKKVEVKESAQIVLSRIERQIRASSIDSVEVKPNHTITLAGVTDAISFLNAIDPNTGMTEYDLDGNMSWKKYIIFYLADDPRVAKGGFYQLWSREVDLGELKDKWATDLISELPYPPLDATPSTDKQAFNTYLDPNLVDTYISQPRPVARNITFLNFTPDPNTALVEIDIRTGKPINPNDPLSEDSEEKIELKGFVVLRND